MAEGMALVNQQVASIGYWERSDRVVPLDDSPMPARRDPAQGNSPGHRRTDIRRAVEADIIPRLLLGHDVASKRCVAEAGAGAFGEPEIQHFAQMLLTRSDDAAVTGHLSGVQARGVPIDVIYLDLFQPAARHIGELWHADLCSFVDVTLAIGTMQKLLRTFGPLFHQNGRPADGLRTAMLAPLPGDQHTFGLSMVAEFFRRGGWSVWTSPFDSVRSLGDRVNNTWFAVVGFSASREDRLDELAAVIRLVRQESCNPSVGIMVGGPAFVNRPDFVTHVGADVVGEDASKALAQAEGFIAPATGP